MNFCPSCGNMIKPGLQFCTVCGKRFIAQGAPVAASPAADSRKRGFLPRYGVRRMRYSEVLKAIWKKLKIPQMVFLALAALAAAGLAAAAVLNIFSELPVQFQVTRHGMYLSTTKAFMKFDNAGDVQWKIGDVGGVRLRGLLDFDFGQDGRIYLANPAAHRVEVFGTDGTWHFSFGERELGEHFTHAVLESGNVIVADTGRHDVKFFTPGGVLISRLGGNGKLPGTFNYPNGVGQMPDGTVLVSETNNLRVQLFDGRTLKFKEDTWSLGGAASSPAGGKAAAARGMRFYWPARLAVDQARERFYVEYVDDFSSPDGYIGIFDFNGKYIGQSHLKTGLGKHIDARTLKPAPKKSFTFVDIEECRAGFWDPDSDNVMPALGDGMSAYLDRMRNIERARRLAGRIGKAAFLAVLLGIVALLSFAYLAYHDLEIARVRAATGDEEIARAATGGKIAAIVFSAVFPGLGQLLLKRYFPGAVFVCLGVLTLLPSYIHYRLVFTNSSMPVPVGLPQPVFLPPYLMAAAAFFVLYAGSLAHAVIRTLRD